MPLDPAVGVIKDIVQLERHRIQVVGCQRLVIVAGLLGKPCESLRAKGGAFGVIDAHGLRQAGRLLVQLLAGILVEPRRRFGQIIIVIQQLRDQLAVGRNIDHAAIQGPPHAVPGKDVLHLIREGTLAKGVAVDPDRIRRRNHLVAKHVGQETFRGLRHDIAVDRHDVGGGSDHHAVGHVRHLVGAIQRRRMALLHMAQQAQLVQVMQFVTNPERGDGAAGGCGHGQPFVSFSATMNRAGRLVEGVSLFEGVWLAPAQSHGRYWGQIPGPVHSPVR